MNFRRTWLALLLLTVSVLSWLTGTWIGYRQIERQSLDESFRYAQLVTNKLERYAPLAELTAQHPLFISVLTNPDSPISITESNTELERIAELTESSDVYLMDTSGLTIAASNYESDKSFIGRNFAFRPYFFEAIQSASSALYFALGITTNERGLYFSHVVTAPDDANTILGVITLKVLVDELEKQWVQPDAPISSNMVVLDADGISFLSSNEDWLFRAFRPISDERLEQIKAQRQYFDKPLTPVNVDLGESSFEFSKLANRMTITEGDIAKQFVTVETQLPPLNWTLWILIETSQVWWVQVQFLITGTSFTFAMFLLFLYIRERLRREQDLSQRGQLLERRVAERTADLEQSNSKLKIEIRDRERFEKELKETQQELIQAAKLAVLGQMSVGLNHEINQPLTAIQTYARNSRQFIERGEYETAKSNLNDIAELCQKMADLTKQFKFFARKSEGIPSAVDLRLPIDAALKIISTHEDRDRVSIRWERDEHPIYVHGDILRIEQVVINLITNAVHAVSNTEKPIVSIEITQNFGEVVCKIIDNGPGLPANTEQLFEPFFTTKARKQGLGLGLSISRQIVGAIGGQLTCQNRQDEQGAVFNLRLNKREMPE